MVTSVVQELIDKTFRELKQAEKPQQRSRISTAPNGYIHLVTWSNASLLRVTTQVFTNSLPKSKYRLKNQLDDAARSVVANIEEGFARPTTGEYLTFLGYSQASLVEVKGDVQRSRQDGILRSIPGSMLTDLGIDLRLWHEALKKTVISKPAEQHKGVYGKLEEVRGRPGQGFKFLYPPVDNLQARDLTYEIFIELINKTDWHLRKLVESLENKLDRDQKFYQVEKARVRSKVRGI